MDLSIVREQIVSCDRCPRLRTYCAQIAREKKAAHRDEQYWGRPVAGFGDPQARLLVLGLAPAAHGANRTGRPFTGDGSGDFLMRALHRTGFANIPTSRDPADGLKLRDAYIAAAVRCAPPDNKPTPEELRSCQVHLENEVGALRQLQVVVALGKIAFDAWWRVMATRNMKPTPQPLFGHGLRYRIDATSASSVTLVIASYHPSRQNTNTGKLTAAMLESVFKKARKALERADS